MKYFLIIFFLISLSFSEEYHDVIYLKDGTIIKGTIIETKPNEYIKIKSGENIFIYNYDQIEIIKKEEYEKINNKSREGFIIGIGAGYHLATNKFEHYNANERHDGLVTDFKLGYSPNNYIEIYYTNKRSTYKPHDLRLYNQLTGFGISFFMNDQLKQMRGKWFPSFFISFCYGNSYYGFDDPDYTYDISGRGGYSFGVGYEFQQNARIEINWISHANMQDYFGEDYFDLKINEFIVTINYMYF